VVTSAERGAQPNNAPASMNMAKKPEDLLNTFERAGLRAFFLDNLQETL
jgi:hypothetical protein